LKKNIKEKDHENNGQRFLRQDGEPKLIGSDIAKRYTRALFDIAQKEDKIEVIYNELKGFSSNF